MTRCILLPVCFALLGCVSSPLSTPMIVINPDDSGGATTYSLAYNNVRPSDDAFRKSVQNIRLDIQRLDVKGMTQYQLVLVYSGTQWLYIKEGESLMLFLDGQRLTLKSARAENTETHGSSVTEGAAYPVTPDQLDRIAHATQVRLKIIGRKGSREASFTPTNTKYFRRFVSRYVEPTTDTRSSTTDE
jgi:hypothetical protein